MVNSMCGFPETSDPLIPEILAGHRVSVQGLPVRAAALASTSLMNSKEAEDLANQIAELLTEHGWKAVSLQGAYSTDPTRGTKLEVRVKGANTDVTP
jgi:hypothetical protein